MKHDFRIHLYFIVVVVLLSLPILGKLGFYINGKKTEGTVLRVETKVTKSYFYTSMSIYSVIEYETSKKVLTVYGPQNKTYTIGAKVPLIYKPSKPSRFIILSPQGMYMNKWFPYTLVSCMIWTAYFFSFKKRRKGARR